MHERAKELREKRAGLVKQAQALLNKESRTSEENAKFDLLMLEADNLKVEIDRVEQIIRAEQELSQRIDSRAGREDTSLMTAQDREVIETRYAQAFGRWMLVGMNDLNPEDRQIMQQRHANLPGIRADQGVGTGAGGGFTVPQGFRAVLENALKLFGGMREASFMLQTDSGESIPMPTENETGSVGELLAENVAATNLDVVFGSLTIDAFMYSSKLVPVSIQLMQDSAFDMNTFLAMKLADRIGRITNQHFTTGTGSGQPRGVVVASVLGKTGIVGQTTSIIFNDLVDLEHSVDPLYRRRPGCRWMMHDSSLKVIKKLVDTQSRPLWLPGIAVQAPDTILGYPYSINQDMAVMAANAKSVLFGDFSKYIIREVRGMGLLRLTERFAEKLQVAFLGFQRYDGDLLDAGTNPVKHYANSAT